MPAARRTPSIQARTPSATSRGGGDKGAGSSGASSASKPGRPGGSAPFCQEGSYQPGAFGG